MNACDINQMLKNLSVEHKDILPVLVTDMEQKYNININLHDVVGVGSTDPILDKLFMSYQYHNNSFCNYVKKYKRSFSLCIGNKERLCNHCCNNSTPFFGTCYMGVDEFVYPISCDGKLIAIICIGQFCLDREKSKQKLKENAELSGFEYAEASKYFDSIIKNLDIDLTNMSKDIKLFSELIVLTFKNALNNNDYSGNVKFHQTINYHKDNFIINNTVNFINENYNRDLSLRLMASNSFCNHTYLSFLFKEKMKICITDYINNIRIEKSKELLNITSKSITEISSMVGFNDSGYFTRVFKNVTDVTPKEYRERKSQK